MAVCQPKKKSGLVEQGMAYGKDPNLEEAIFAVREVDHISRDIPIICKTRGMACAVEVGGKQRLLTWQGVINEHDQAKPIRLHRYLKNIFTAQKNCWLEMSQIKQTDICSFISVKRGDARTPNIDFGILKLKVLGSVEKSKEVSAHSFIGCKDIVKFTFKYDRGKHELKCSDKKYCIFEKSSILGSPIIIDKCHVIGVVGEDRNGRLCPYFLTETEVGK